MPNLKIVNSTGADQGNLEVSPAVFGVEVNPVLIAEAYHVFRANQRQGTHKAKGRSDVRGGGRKPWKQKGTGRARQGSIRAPHWVGGGVVFGPAPRDYRQKFNKKKRQGAFRSLLSSKLLNGEITVVDRFDLGDTPKTKLAEQFLEKLDAKGTILLVTKEKNDVLLLSSRNLPYAKCQVVNAVSIFDLLISDVMIIEKEALLELQERLS